MLEWIRERNQGWLAKIILTLVTVPFALFGINSYFNHNAGADVVATVDGQKISMLTYEHAIKQQAERLRATLGPDAVKAMDDPRMRKEVLDSLVRQRAMVAEAQRLGMVVSDSQLATFIGAIPAFQKNGKFDLETYQMVLRQQGLAVKQFEQMARDELMMQDLRAAFADAQQIPSVSARLFFAAFDQQREISAVTLQVKDQPVVVPDDAKIAAYYKAHIADFTLPMRAKFAYLVLSEDSLASQIKVSDADIKAWYDEHLAQYAQPETRQARHILIAVSPADNAQKHAAALKQAQDIQQQLQQHPERFAALAKQYSADPGSAAQGGDLGWFERGAMVKPFADAVYSMKLNAISPPVLSDFGYHIIQLTGVRPAVTRDLASVRDDIVAELQKQRAEKQFADAAERFSNQVFEQSDDLAPTAKSLGLVEQTSGWVTRSGSETSLLAGDKIRQALFSDDVLKHRHNTAAIEVSPNVLVAARLLQSEPARVQSLAEVKPQIIALLQAESQKAALATRGAAILASLQQGKEPTGLGWSAFTWISRMHADGVPPTMLTDVFAADAHKLPAYLGQTDASGNYHLVRVTRVQAGPNPDANQLAQMTSQLASMQSQQVFDDYVAAVLAHAKIQVNQKLLMAH